MDMETANAINSVMKTLTEAIQRVDALYQKICNKTNSDVSDAEEAIAETYEITDSNSTDITDLQEAIAELYELLEG